MIPVAAAVALATLARWQMLGVQAVFAVAGPPLPSSAVVLGCCVLLGVAAGLLGLVLTGLVYTAEDAFTRLPIHWMWWPALGGLIIGLGGRW